MGMATILLNDNHISSMVREAYFDRSRTIFLAKYVINKEILFDYRCFSCIFWYTLSNHTARLTLSAL